MLTKKFSNYLIITSILVFVIGIILISVGIDKYERVIINCHENEYKSLATVLNANRYTTNCDYCIQLKIKYHTYEHGEIITYMRVKCDFNGCYDNMESTHSDNNKFTIYYDIDNPGKPRQEKKSCLPRGSYLILMIMGVLTTIFGFSMLILVIYSNKLPIIWNYIPQPPPKQLAHATNKIEKKNNDKDIYITGEENF
jgi:hypothetical protein